MAQFVHTKGSMNIVNEATAGGKRAVRGAADQIAPWIVITARIGFAALGLVYIIVGFLSARAAMGDGDTANAEEALRVIGTQPFGQVLLWICALGLAGYAVWRFIQAATDPGDQGTGRRVMNAIKGVVHLALAVTAGRLAMGSSDSGSSSGGFLQSLIQHDVGRWLVVAGAIGLGVYGVKEIIKAVRRDLDDRLDLSSLSSGARTAVIQLARWGIAARGLVFAALGVLVALAAMRGGNAEEQDTDNALNLLGGLPGGQIILWVTAAGLVAYGIYSFVRARYRRIETT